MRKLRSKTLLIDWIFLIALLKSINEEKIRAVKQQILRDPVSRKILELADGTREYGLLADEVAKATEKIIRTVKARISELFEKGAIRGDALRRRCSYGG